MEVQKGGKKTGRVKDDSNPFGRWVVSFLVIGKRACMCGGGRQGVTEGCSPGLVLQIYDIIKSQVPSTFLLAISEHRFPSHGPKMAAIRLTPYLHLKQEDEKESNMNERSSNLYLKKENFPRNLLRLLLISPWPKFCPKASPCCQGCWEIQLYN